MSLRPLAASIVRLCTLVGVVAASLVACARGTQQTGATAAPAQQRPPAAIADSARAAPADTVASPAEPPRPAVADTAPRSVDTTSRRVAPAPPRAPARTAPSTPAARTAPRASPARGALGSRAGARHMAYRDAGSDLDSLWPVKGPAPLPGSILPGHRIVAFYGIPLSRRMGILGEFDPDVMLRKLDAEVATWNRLDPSTPVKPALHLIVLVANPHPGPSGKYRTRHDSAMIEKVYGWARSRNALLFLDLQVGHSTLQQELPWVEKFLVRPDVHLGIDPEFSMKTGAVPGTRVGTYDAADINYASRFLANLVDRHRLPPKILVVHRYTSGGVTNARKIALDPRVQIVMHMDGFGPPWVKRDTYWRDIKREPVQFTGWKQFTKARNDNPPTPREEILRLWPVPLYIQYQ